MAAEVPDAGTHAHALQHVALMLGKYSGELNGIALQLQSKNPEKRSRGRRRAVKWVKHRLPSLNWCMREAETLLVRDIVASTMGVSTSTPK